MPDIHCWAGEEDHMSDEERWAREVALYFGEPGARDFGICMLADGHDGPHVWTDPGEIVVRFSDE